MQLHEHRLVFYGDFMLKHSKYVRAKFPWRTNAESDALARCFFGYALPIPIRRFPAVHCVELSKTPRGPGCDWVAGSRNITSCTANSEIGKLRRRTGGRHLVK